MKCKLCGSQMTLLISPNGMFESCDKCGHTVEFDWTKLGEKYDGIGFELIEYLASLYNCEIEIVDNTEKSEQQELVEDLIQIITVFSCRLQGKRANKTGKLVKELIDGGEDNDKNG